ncbi:hypothetical protein GWK08_01385 [Leptobacterium flavescens]|uniref:NnrS family protein n=1 Tax=Leptobacterium flavescens TaxID=472055 RepID=A0A6P0UFM1_9FLAO|nr:hypothetical protein [Leptobacterium flavescens]NER12081.1 hypothetical protein [Leptobacterium flavescens]
MNSKWSKISLFFLFYVALVGTLMRAISYVRLPFQYDHLVHSHSHVAFQGWIYTLLMLFTTRLFLTKEQIRKGKYSLQFKITVLIIVGVLVSFALQGYALYSIIFSSLFQLLNYWFIFRFFKDSKKKERATPYSISLRFIRTGFWLGLLSTLAPWGIGILAAKGLAGTEAYHSFVYFFLHFQYNGWFLFAVLGLFFKQLEMEQVPFDRKKARYFYLMFTWAVIPAYSLSLLGMSFKGLIMIPAVLSAGIQLLGLVFFWQILRGAGVWFLKKPPLYKLFMFTALASFFIKVALQFMSVFPVFEAYAFGSKNVILAYLHLSLIGVISFMLMALLIQFKWIKTNMFTVVGSIFLFLGFVVSEAILALSGIGVFQLYTSLLIFSAAMALGILILLLSPYKTRES